MIRRTKIVATLGPASSDAAVLERMIAAGVDVVRMNFSHGTAAEHTARAAMVRDIAARLGRTVGILADLQGPKIRIGKFADGKISLAPGEAFILDAGCALGDQQRVGLDYKELPDDVVVGDCLLLDDGRLEFLVERIDGRCIHCRVVLGGVLSNNKGINRKGGGLTAPALTDKDKADIITAAALQADFLAVSFPRSGADMALAGELLRQAGGKALLIAKIERAEAIPALDDILSACDAIMVARGDLAVEVGDAVVPGLQKKLIREARRHNKLVITATQMMESMISSPIPTRAEVSDVANAVLDGTDAVMLSAESAAGQFPVEAVAAMVRVCLEAEKEYVLSQDIRLEQSSADKVEEAIAHSTVLTPNRVDVRAIAALTESGMTPQLMSRMGTNVPIYAISPNIDTLRKVTLYRGVYPVPSSLLSGDPDTVLQATQDILRQLGVVADNDLIVVTMGVPFGKVGSTNTMKIIAVAPAAKH